MIQNSILFIIDGVTNSWNCWV